MRALIVALIFHLTLNPLVFFAGRNVLKKYKWPNRIWTTIFLAEFLFFIVVLLFYRHLPLPVITFGRVLGTSWLTFTLYTAGTALILELLYLLFTGNLLNPKALIKQPQRVKTTLFVITLVFVVSILSYGRYNFRHPVVNHLNIEISKNNHRHDSLRIVVAGDIHLGYIINRDDARRMVDLIMQQNADLILLVGDIIDASIEPVMEQNMGEELKRLHAPLGVFSCPGNHEYRLEYEQKIQYLNNCGITMLRDSAVLVDSSFYVIGREDIVIPERLPIDELMERQHVDLSKPIFVLSHTPIKLEDQVNAGADLSLYGHTHHGQVFPGNIAVELKFEVAYGYKKIENSHIYVTSGLGLAGPQFRIGTVSEIAVMDVKFNN